MDTKEELIYNIKKVSKSHGFAYCYEMPIPENISFYALRYNSDNNLILTNEEMDKYFPKYTKWREAFTPYQCRELNEFYVIEDDELAKFLISKYYTRKIEEKLGKQF